jgi:hypothetical protein
MRERVLKSIENLPSVLILTEGTRTETEKEIMQYIK